MYTVSDGETLRIVPATTVQSYYKVSQECPTVFRASAQTLRFQVVARLFKVPKPALNRQFPRWRATGGAIAAPITKPCATFGE